MGVVAAVSVAVAVAAAVVTSLRIVFPPNAGGRPFCGGLELQVVVSAGRESDLFPGAFYLTEQQATDYYWMVVFIPSASIFFASILYLVAGITVAYSAPARHRCLAIVENNYCASKRAFFLRRKAAVVLDEGDYAGRNLGLEMLEAPQIITPDMERRVNEGFKAWMGSSLLSSDDEEGGPDDEAYPIQTSSLHLRE